MKKSASNFSEQPPPAITVEHVIEELQQKGNPNSVVGMARFGIQTGKALGVSIPQLREVAKQVGTNHELAQKLWKTGIHEARILASMIDNPEKVSEDQMERWAEDFDSWDVVDGCCGNLFDKTEFAVRKAHEWSERKEEYIKRAGFALMAELAVHDKKASDKTFLDFLPVIVRESSDERNFVKKAVNWALRQIGKRNPVLNVAAIKTCATIKNSDSRSAKWIAADALRELTSVYVRKKLASASRQGSDRKDLCSYTQSWRILS
jgi:3-methyladenine DNA glycosylase AlkD